MGREGQPRQEDLQPLYRRDGFPAVLQNAAGPALRPFLRLGAALFRVNEGPFFLPGKDHVYISFSASATGACYCIGLLCAPAGADLPDPNAWRKLRQPALRTDERVGLYGPGHNSFFRDDAGNTLMAYHARRYDEITGDPLYDPNRRCYLMKVAWQDDRPCFSYENNLRFE